MSDTTIAAQAELVRSDDGRTARFAVIGDWRIDTAAQLAAEVEAVGKNIPAHVVIDLSRAGIIDTSGAWMLYRLSRSLAAAGAEVEWQGMTVNARRLLQAVAVEAAANPVVPPRAGVGVRFLASIGRPVAAFGADAVRWTGILGGVVTGFARGLTSLRRLRLTSIVHHLELAGLRAVPINLAIGFAIGVIIAQQGAYQFSIYVPGPDLLVVDLTAFLILREISVLLAAMMLAGRSGSAITAEIGSMKMREEIDALKVIGLDPNQILVMPRVVSLVIALPILTFLIGVSGLIGGAVVCYFYLDMPIDVFIDRLTVTRTENLLAGLIKALFMAVAIGVIAASEGLKVAGSTESLGRHTTAAVVKAILVVIVIDGFFAIFFAAIGF